MPPRLLLIALPKGLQQKGEWGSMPPRLLLHEQMYIAKDIVTVEEIVRLLVDECDKSVPGTDKTNKN